MVYVIQKGSGTKNITKQYFMEETKLNNPARLQNWFLHIDNWTKIRVCIWVLTKRHNCLTAPSSHKPMLSNSSSSMTSPTCNSSATKNPGVWIHQFAIRNCLIPKWIVRIVFKSPTIHVRQPGGLQRSQVIATGRGSGDPTSGQRTPKSGDSK